MTDSSTSTPSDDILETTASEKLQTEPLVVPPADLVPPAIRGGAFPEKPSDEGGANNGPSNGDNNNTSGSGQHWTDEPNKGKRRFNRFTRLSSLIAVGFFSFLFFLYLTFPYGVIKEVLVLQISDVLQKSGLPIQVRIGTLSPYWLTGVKFTDFVVSNTNDKSIQLKLNEVTVRVNILPFLIGNISVNAYVEQGNGEAEAFFKASIAGLLKGALPKEVSISFKDFALEPIFNHALAIPKSSRDPNMLLIQPIIAKTTAGGQLTGTVLFESSDKMKGRVNLDAKNAFLLIDDETLKIPKQDFSVFKLDVQYQNGNLTFGESTKFQAPDIGIGLNGTVALPETPTASAQANLNLSLSMHGNIEKSLGMIVPNILRCRPLTNGELTAKLQGPVSQMSCQ